jgi:hypothetical protein
MPNTSQCCSRVIVQNVTGIAIIYDSSKTSADPVAGIPPHCPYSTLAPNRVDGITTGWRNLTSRQPSGVRDNSSAMAFGALLCICMILVASISCLQTN